MRYFRNILSASLLAFAAPAFAQVNLVNVGYTNIGSVADIEVVGNLAYLACGANGLRIFDVSNPANPVRVGQILSSSGAADGVAVSGNYAYVANNSDGLRIYDVSNPATPINVGHTNIGGFPAGVAVSGNYAYLVGSDTGLKICDVSDPANPAFVGQTNIGVAHAVIISGHYAYVTLVYTGHTFDICDISDPTNPTVVYQGIPGGGSWGEAISSNRLYLAEGNGALSIYDISNPASPSIVGQTNISIYAGAGLVVTNGWAYLANGQYGVQIYDVSNPTNIVRLGSTNYSGTVQAASGNCIYLNDSLRILQTVGPQLTMGVTNTGALWISWPTNLIAFTLQQNSDLTGTDWEPVPDSPVVVSNWNQVILSPTATNTFFRLQYP